VLEWLPARSQNAAAFLHQLGMVAQKRGDYDAALEGYRKALAIDDALGDCAGMAGSLSQMGVLLTETGKPTEAVRFNLQSLALRLELRVPEVRIDLHWLGRQREALGQGAFQAALRGHLDEENADAMLKMLEDAGHQAHGARKAPKRRFAEWLRARLARWAGRRGPS
jgi:tetratricopeptide (TPR) repeat protein